MVDGELLGGEDGEGPPVHTNSLWGVIKMF